MDADLLKPSPLLDYQHPTLAALVAQRGWMNLPTSARVGAVYDFVRDEIAFGYNRTDAIPASEVLSDGYGQCNTKSTLLMALLRAVGVPTRLHGATIHKRLQQGVVTGLKYWLAPTDIFHSWTEVLLDGRWVGLEGVILDRAYLSGLKAHLGQEEGPLVGYAVGTANLAKPDIEWRGETTTVQMLGVNRDLGLYATPDAFYAEHGGNLSGVKAWLYAKFLRHQLNARVRELRSATPLAMCAVSVGSPSQAP
jgi:hypothetical protein